jgi:hypothetical protein
MTRLRIGFVGRRGPGADAAAPDEPAAEDFGAELPQALRTASMTDSATATDESFLFHCTFLRLCFHPWFAKYFTERFHPVR